MSGEIEQRLVDAARAAREYDLCGQQHAQLRTREHTAEADLDRALEYAGAEKDVEWLPERGLQSGPRYTGR